jgi:uncharacterized protein
MVHLLPLPGSPGWAGDVEAIYSAAESDAAALFEGGCDAVIVENMGDVPYLRGRVEPETVAAMAVATERVARLGPTGVAVLAAANRQALGVAVASGASFLRVEAFAYAHVADEGWIDACAGELLRAKRSLGVDVQIWADVRKKHAAHAVTADVTLAELARGTAFCGADALVVTGAATGEPTLAADVTAVREAGLPVLVGSGVTPDCVPPADGYIVGSWCKVGGDWRNRVDRARVEALVAAVRGA